jgi:uncharacterized protein YbjT (DUF2867 family)
VTTGDVILVVGATGGVGQQVTRKLLARQQPVCMLVRNIVRAKTLFGEVPCAFVGDTRQPETLTPALENVRAAICATGATTPTGSNSPEHVDYQGVRNLVEAARAAGVDHFVLISSCAVTKPDHPLNNFGQVLTWKLKGEDALRASGLTFTIVRPGGLTNEPGGQAALQFDQGDRISGLISRADVAEVCLQTLHQPNARNVTFEVIQAPGGPVDDWAALFATLRPEG